MSRVGKSPVVIPQGVTVSIDGGVVTVSGTKGTLSQSLMAPITIKQENDTLVFSRPNDEPTNRAIHGLMRSLVQNMVTGVSGGFSKQLELNGVGYRVALSGTNLKLQLGFSHEVNYAIPTGVEVKVEQNIMTISGIDKQLVGQVAADIRSLKKPEPYKGKGIKYVDERIIRKSGKSGKEKA
jgi:large subunit ribosomal protein L6